VAEDTKEIKHCSFCEKEEASVLMLVSSPTAGICNECVGVVVQLMAEYMKNNKIGDKDK
jgi:ATP-dependent protease Clp ATPase subunit